MKKVLYTYTKKEVRSAMIFTTEWHHNYCTKCRKKLQDCMCESYVSKKRRKKDEPCQVTKAEAAINNGMISLTTEGFEWFVPRWPYHGNKQLTKKNWKNEVSYDLVTGEIRYERTYGTLKETKEDFNGDFSKISLMKPYRDPDSTNTYDPGWSGIAASAIQAFNERLLKAAGIPESIFEERNLQTERSLNVIMMITTAPNLAIRTENGKSKFRTKDQTGLITYARDTKELEAFYKLQPKQLMEEEDYIEYMLMMTGVKVSNELMEMYREDPTYIGWSNYVNDEFRIRNSENVRKMLKGLEGLRKYKRKRDDMAIAYPFIKALIKEKGEDNGIDEMLRWSRNNTYANLFIDTCFMYNEIMKGSPDTSVCMSGDIREIQRRLKEMEKCA